jgi:DNA end-binding protein Ku
MARAIWKGSLSFGLVNIPVELHVAESTRELHFNLLDRRDLKPIHYQRVNAATGREVPWDQTVRGFEFERDRYVVLTDEDLRRANPASTQTIEIVDFVALEAIGSLYFSKPYFLAPERRSRRSYALLREALRRSGKVGIARVVIRTRQHLAAVIPWGEAIVLNLMRFHDELRDPAELDLPAGRQGTTAREMKLAEQLIAAMAEGWDPERYRDDYRVDVQALIERRVAAGQLAAGPKAAAPRQPRGKVVDLMTLLKRSVEEGGRARPGAAEKAAAPSRAGRAVRPRPAAGHRQAAKPAAAPKARQKRPAAGARQGAGAAHRRAGRRTA